MEKTKAIEAQKAKKLERQTKRTEWKSDHQEEAQQENVLNIDFKPNFKEKIEGQIKEAEEKNEEELTETVHEIFDGFKLNLPSLLFYFFFILRRQVMVVILIFMPSYGLF